MITDLHSNDLWNVTSDDISHSSPSQVVKDSIDSCLCPAGRACIDFALVQRHVYNDAGQVIVAPLERINSARAAASAVRVRR